MLLFDLDSADSNSPFIHHFTDSLQDKLDHLLRHHSERFKTLKSDIFKWILIDCTEQRFKLEGEFRVLQSTINFFASHDGEINTIIDEFTDFFEHFQLHIQKCRIYLETTSNNNSWEEQLLDLIQPLLEASPESFQHLSIQHRNFCLYLLTQVKLDSTSQLFQQVLIRYLGTLLNDCENVQVLQCALKLLETLKTAIFNVKVMVALDKLASAYDINNLLNLYEMQNSPELRKFQVGFEARWLIDNLISKSVNRSNWTGLKANQIVKMSTDGLIVQGSTVQTRLDPNNNDFLCKNSNISTVRCSVPIGASSFYYEVLLLTGGFMTIGWTTREAELGPWKQVGTDTYSLGLDGYHQCLWHNGKFFFLERFSWKPGDVIGCGIDFQKGEFTFYLNGRLISFETDDKEINLSGQPYFPAVSLTKDQMVAFNLGQVPFKFQSGNYQKIEFPKIPRFLEPLIVDSSYAFEEPEELFIFTDDKQESFKQMIIDLQRNTSSTSIRYQSHLGKLEHRFLKLIGESDNGRLRMLQAILITLDQSITGKKIDWIRWIFLESLSLSDNLQPSTAKYIEFLYPHILAFFQNSNSNQNLSQISQRNLFLILSLISSSNPYILIPQIAKFLTKIILECEKNKLALLYALISLNSVEYSNKELLCDETLELLTNEQFLEKLKKLSSYMKKSRFLNPYTLDFIQYQIAFCATKARENILEHLLENNEQLTISSESDDFEMLKNLKNTEMLSAQDCSRRIQLSNDFFSARNDSPDRQTVLGEFSILHGESGFCEFILLTSGQMRIGFTRDWADLAEGVPIGSSEYSLAFDGYSRSVHFDGKEYSLQVNGSSGRWKIGDVIGCLIDRTSSGTIALYRNGKELATPKECSAFVENAENDESRLCFAVSLGSQQQVYCNFGQKPFRYSVY